MEAAKSFRPGDKIYSEEPYEAVLYDDSAANRCHYTFKDPEKLHRCDAHSWSTINWRAARTISKNSILVASDNLSRTRLLLQMHWMQIRQVFLKGCAESCMGQWPQRRMCSVEGMRPKNASSNNQARGKGTLETPQVHLSSINPVISGCCHMESAQYSALVPKIEFHLMPKIP